ncbi:MAG: SCO family protein [Arenicella sp.]|nr:SCO family protein [Arenicella sp.]
MKTISLSVPFCMLLLLPSITKADSDGANQTLPDTSIYHIESSWQDQHGETFNITELKGEVRLVAFVYTYCEHTCPIIITRIRSIVNALSKDAKQKTIVTLVTLDPKRDTVERVKQYMIDKDLDDQNWQILVGTADDVLTLSALFDVRYKPMGESDIAHSNAITLVDKQGVVRMQLRNLSQSTEKMVKLTEELN